MAARTLHVRCATWEQVEVFTQRKLRKGKLLSMKVPFAAQQGAQVTIGLELPNEVVIAIDGVIQKSAPVEVDGKSDATDVDRDRARRLHRRGQGAAQALVPERDAASRRPIRRFRSSRPPRNAAR